MVICGVSIVSGIKTREAGILATHSDAERKRYVFTVSLDMQGNEWVLTDKGYFVYGNNALKGNDAYRYTASVGKRFSWQIVETS